MSKRQAIQSNSAALAKLRVQSLDVQRDPYLARHGTQFQCKLCLTVHTSLNSYLLHTQGKKHLQQLEARSKLDAKPAKPKACISAITPHKYVKIGVPVYKLTKIRDKDGRLGVLFNLKYPQISPNTGPKYRFMSAFEQNVKSKHENVQYLVIAAEPYDTVAFKLPVKSWDLWSYFDEDLHEFYLQLLVK